MVPLGNFGGKEKIEHLRDFTGGLSFSEHLHDWMLDNPILAQFIFFGIIAIICLIVVLTWLKSRGAFMFLDNVVHNKSQIAFPWKEYRNEGNSIFLWQIVFGLICFALVIYMAMFFLAGTGLVYFSGFNEVSVFSLLSAGLFSFVLIIVIAYISMFLNNFVIPIMYLKRVNVLEGWRLFLHLFRKQTGSFILYGLFLVILYVMLVAGIIFVGFFTCCLGFVLVALPYIGSVVLLPFSYTFRAYSVEFLEQFGDDYQFFPPEVIEPEPTAEQ